MEDNYRNNVVDFCLIYNGKSIDDDLDFCLKDFVIYIFRQLFNVDINRYGYGLDNSTILLTNDIGDLKIYNKFDINKSKYIEDIKKGDLVFFHELSLESNSPTFSNYYPGNVGIYLGDKKFIYFDLEKEEIRVDNISDRWLDILVASRDIIKGILEEKF